MGAKGNRFHFSGAKVRLFVEYTNKKYKKVIFLNIISSIICYNLVFQSNCTIFAGEWN